MDANTTISATDNKQTESELLAGISKSPVLKKAMEKSPELQNFITNFKNLVMTENELAFRTCVGFDQPFSEKFVNFFKWIWKNICYYVGSVNFKKGVNFAGKLAEKYPDKIPFELDKSTKSVLDMFEDGIKVPLSSIKGLIKLISGDVPKVEVDDIIPNAQEMEQAKTAIENGLKDARIDISNVKFNEEDRTVEINGKEYSLLNGKDINIAPSQEDNGKITLKTGDGKISLDLDRSAIPQSFLSLFGITGQ